MKRARLSNFALFAMPVLIAATLSTQATGQTASEPPTPVINHAAIDRISVKPAASPAVRGKPRTHSTWCRATGSQPASKMAPRGGQSYGAGVLTRNQISSCAARAPALCALALTVYRPSSHPTNHG